MANNLIFDYIIVKVSSLWRHYIEPSKLNIRSTNALLENAVKPAVPYHLRDYYTSSNGSAKCRAAECKYTTKINTKDLVDHKKTDHPDWTINPRPKQLNFQQRKTAIKTLQNNQQIFQNTKEKSKLCKVQCKQMWQIHLVKQKRNQSNFDNLPEFKAKCRTCGSVISYLRDVGHLNEHLNKSVRCRTKDQHKPSTSSSTPYIKDPSTGKYIPAPQSQEQVPSDMKRNLYPLRPLSISTPTSCVTDPSEADTDDTHEQKSGEPDTDGTRKRKSTEVDIDDTRKRRSGGADDDE
ncbi:hypothetical protein DBV15_03054 [Temnothorax longispinosus]|uniref:Uncharacterized protein n=1 Tax=Temnothorax longispinosus TaxID=300112 RepID=A0A4S2KJH5_9HYME|nr:hypothetical protein DBV15_03054 [Temnothorax longispinosus]